MKTMLQALLYYHPMYRCISGEGKDINVLVFGGGRAAFAFLDCALVAGQVAEHGLNITVCTAQPEERLLEYCEARPALEEFINLKTDEPLTVHPDSYGTLRFVGPVAEDGLDAFLLTPCFIGTQERYHYIFICTGEDAENRRMAQRCLTAAQTWPQWGEHTLIARMDGGRVALTTAQGDVPVPTALEARPELALTLRDMAFNAHLLWCLQSNGSVSVAWERFNAPEAAYERESSLAYVMSVRSKLWSAGIDESDPDTAAKLFQARLAEDASLFPRLMALEQRRWVMEKVTAGYERAGSDLYETFVEKGTLKVGNRNVCILRCGETMPLEGREYRQNGRRAWDQPGPQDDALDALDRMSVELHRFMRERAQALRESELLSRGPVAELDELVRGTEPAGNQRVGRRINRLRVEYDRFLFCVKSILDGSPVYARSLGDFRADLQAAFDAALPQEGETVRRALAEIERRLFPAVEANQYRSFKRNNEAFVKGIPFVLTYRRFSAMAMPFCTAQHQADVNDRIFQNLASPIVIRPGTLVYLLNADAQTSLELFTSMLKGCVTYLREEDLPTRVYLAIRLDAGMTKRRTGQWQQQAAQWQQEGLIGGAEFCIGGDAAAFFVQQMDALNADLYDGTTPLFASAIDNAVFVQRMYRERGYFEMDCATKAFRTNEKARWLTCIDDRSVLRIDRMFALLNGYNTTHAYPDYAELVVDGDGVEPLFERLWKIYTGRLTGQRMDSAVWQWNVLCDALEPKNLARMRQVGSLTDEASGRTLQWDMLCRNAAAWGMRTVGQRGQAERILLKLAEIRTRTGRALLTLQYNAAGRIERVCAEKKNIADMLTSAGSIVEVYSFFKAFETGYFDDIACGYEFSWGYPEYADTAQRNEIDLILTKGFRSLMAECKGTARLEQGFYHKLNSMADLFGINTVKVLIANMYSRNNERLNEDQIARGRLLDIRTVSDLDEVGAKLVEIHGRP